jgi:selenocysteine-specific elongation factor
MMRRKNIMLGTAGHVDHGKTALVKLLTGCDTDRLAAEKARGLTIELGFAPCRMSDERIVGIVDVPGHHGFIRNMAAGAHGVDVVILVVAADDGVMPQTREHLDILTLMGTRQGLIALTKIDLVDEEMRELVIEDLRETLRGTFLESAAICPMSNITGEGFDGFLTALNEAVDRAPQRETSGLFRLWVERSFHIKGFGTVVSGIPTSGEVNVGEKLRIAGLDRQVRVRRLEVYGEDAEVGRAGECVALNVLDADADDLPRGCLLSAGECCEPVSMFEADVQLHPSATCELADFAAAHLHIGTAETTARIVLLEGEPLEPGRSALAQLRLERALPVACGERFILRASLPGAPSGQITTIGGGVVLATSDRKLKRQRQTTLAALDARREALGKPRAWAELLLRESAARVGVTDLAKRMLLPNEQAQALADDLALAGRALTVDRAVAHCDLVAELETRGFAVVEQHHQAHPQLRGINESALAAHISEDSDLSCCVIQRLVESGRLVRHGELLALPRHVAAIGDEDERLCEALESLLLRDCLSPPTISEAADLLGEAVPTIERAAALLQDQGRATRLDERLVMHAEAVERAKQTALALFRAGAGFSTAEFRDSLGASRKYAVPLLDHLDQLSWTVRTANRRTPGRAAREALQKGDA